MDGEDISQLNRLSRRVGGKGEGGEDNGGRE